MPKGYIKNWRRDRGFGFINVDGQDDDVFVHISELRDLGRPPRVGDEITFEIEMQDNGKNRAINCKVKGQKSSNTQSNSNSSNSNNSGVSGSNKTIIIGVIIVAVILLAWLTLN